MFFKIGVVLVIIRCGKKKQNVRFLVFGCLLIVSVRLLVVCSRMLVICGRFWLVAGRLWSFMVACGRFFVVCGRLWWFLVVACFSNYVF